MKTVAVPTRSLLLSAYEKLQWESHVSVTQLCLWTRWARLDARLAQILVDHIVNHFEAYNALDLWEKNQALSQPQALAVILEFCQTQARLSLKQKKYVKFQIWKRAIVSQLSPAPFQRFFIREGTLAPERDQKEISENLPSYENWGYYFNEPITSSIKNKRSDSTRTLLSSRDRLEILRALMKEKKVFTVNDYMSACHGRIHRRTAERDLEKQNKLKKVGATRSRNYKSDRF